MMAKTRDQIITRALRKLGVVAEDMDPSDAMLANSSAALDGVLAELRAASPVFTWTTTFPNDVANALTDLLAVELSPEYPIVKPPYPRPVAWARLMGVARLDDRFAYTFTGQWGIEAIDGTTFGYERSEVIGTLMPMMAGVREVSAKTDTGVFRIRTDGRNKINGLDQLEVRLSSWQEPQTILTWSGTTREYSVTNAPLVAWVAGLVGQTTQLTISDPNYNDDARAASAWF